ncbi:hypothetical protein D3C73_1596490 [compost metagenome]
MAELVGSTAAVWPLGVVITKSPVRRWIASTAARLLHADGCRYTGQRVLLCCVVCMARTLW